MKEYHCLERTLDVKLPWGGLSVRIWFDATFPQWADDQQLQELGHNIRRELPQADIEKVLEAYAALPGVNAIQVKRSRGTSDIEVGLMAYTVPFDEPNVFDSGRDIVLGPGSKTEVPKVKELTERLSGVKK